MACGGCKERARLLAESARAASRGDGRGSMRALAQVGRSAADDVRAIATRTRERASARLRARVSGRT